MKKKIINIYSQVLMDLCENDPTLEKQFQEFIFLLQENETLHKLLFTRAVSKNEKQNCLKDLFEKLQSSEIFRAYLLHLLESGRLELLLGIESVFSKLVLKKKGLRRVRIDGSHDLIDMKTLEIFNKKIQLFFKEKLLFDYFKNEKITAGYRAQIEDLQLDLTLDTQLQKLTKRRKLQ